MKKRILGMTLSAVMAMGFLAGCANSASSTPSASETQNTSGNQKGSVYYLNFKPEQADQWKELAETYTKQTGVPVNVVTAAAGTYESTLKSEMAKKEAPTLFQVNGPVGLQAWKDYTYDLSDTELYKQLSNESFALKDGDKVAGVAYVIETYGLIYNKALLKKAGYTADDIKNFNDLKRVAQDIQKRKDELGVEGAFTSAGMDPSSDWRFKTHLANIPVYYEYQKDGITFTDAIKGTYLDQYKQIWDLYLQNSTTEPALISKKTGDDATAEFATGAAVFYQNGTWAYDQIKDQDVADEDIGMLPIYIGVPGEENQGLSTGSENFWAINAKASQEDINATIDFVNWCITSEEGKKGFQKMGFVAPFKTFTKEYLPENPLILAANDDVAKGNKPVDWNFTTMPSEEWKNGVGSALLEYAQGTADWEHVKKAFIDGWISEYKAVNG